MSFRHQLQPQIPSSALFTVARSAIVSTDHRLIGVSDAFAELIGYTPQELCGRTFESITYPADADIDSDLANRLFRGELREYEIAKRYVHADGSLIRILLHASAVRDAHGRIQHAIAHIRPITGSTGSLPKFQHRDAANDEIERIKRAMLFGSAQA